MNPDAAKHRGSPGTGKSLHKNGPHALGERIGSSGFHVLRQAVQAADPDIAATELLGGDPHDAPARIASSTNQHLKLSKSERVTSRNPHHSRISARKRLMVRPSQSKSCQVSMGDPELFGYHRKNLLVHLRLVIWKPAFDLKELQKNSKSEAPVGCSIRQQALFLWENKPVFRAKN